MWHGPDGAVQAAPADAGAARDQTFSSMRAALPDRSRR